MAEIKISNILVNDDSSQVLSYGRQTKDDTIVWDAYPKVKRHHPELINEDGKRQNSLNNLFLNLHEEFHKFLEDEGVLPGVIDSWHEVEQFLKNIHDKSTLNGLLGPIYTNQGILTIEMNPEVPGQLIAGYASEDLYLGSKTQIDPKTGQVILQFDFSTTYPTEYPVQEDNK